MLSLFFQRDDKVGVWVIRLLLGVGDGLCSLSLSATKSQKHI